MNKIRDRHRFLIALVVCFTSMAAQAETDFECPDFNANELTRLARLYGPDPTYGTAIGRYKYVIKNASRPMDYHARGLACYNLASYYFRTNCSDYEYECPPRHNKLRQWPASLNDWIDKLKSQYPILLQCPEKSIYRDNKLPVVRVWSVPSPEILAQKITGWVELEVDIDTEGYVKNVVLVDSSSSLLGAPAVKAALNFRYYPAVDDNGPISESGVPLTITTNYSDLAQFAGCAAIW